MTRDLSGGLVNRTAWPARSGLLLLLCIQSAVWAQAPGGAGRQGGPGAAPGGGGAAGRGGVPAYPAPVVDAVAVARGRALYNAHTCSFCHGADARGGNAGPSLLRSAKVLNDKKGEGIFETVTRGVPNTAMVGAPLSMAEVADIAEFLHSFEVGGRDSVRQQPAVFKLGNANAGQRYFTANCASCHSAAGDLKGVAAKFAQPRDLQQRWLMPTAGAPPTTATVTPANGAPVSGLLVRIDEFSVTVSQQDGTQRTFTRRGDQPRVEVQDALKAHQALLPRYADSDIHNVTAYLVTLK